MDGIGEQLVDHRIEWVQAGRAPRAQQPIGGRQRADGVARAVAGRDAQFDRLAGLAPPSSVTQPLRAGVP